MEFVRYLHPHRSLCLLLYNRKGHQKIVQQDRGSKESKVLDRTRSIAIEYQSKVEFGRIVNRYSADRPGRAYRHQYHLCFPHDISSRDE
jgi:hypothetical protein